MIQLNDRWRVVDDPIQWILERRKRNPGKRSTGYEGERFHRKRRFLMQSIRELCGPVDPAALAEIETWPELHPDRETGAG